MAENYSRCLNIWVAGLAKGTETGQSVDFFESWLPHFLKITNKSGHIKLETVHRSVAQKLDPNKNPRSLLLQFHTFRDKQRVMEAERRASQNGALLA